MGLFLLLCAAILVLNYGTLTSVIPYRGDETLHIERTLELVERIPYGGALVIVLLFILFIVSGIKKQKWMVLIGIVLSACVIFFFLGASSFEDVIETPAFFLRYPFINYWLYAVFPKLASLMESQYHEVLYRIIPILSMIGTAWVFQNRANMSIPLGNIAWGLAVATIPLIFYYSSILYIEPPAVFLMTVASLEINDLLHKSSRDILGVPGWYALILIGFIKETAVLFLFCFVAVRMIVQLQIWLKRIGRDRSKKSLANLLAGEIGVMFSVLAPAFLYLYFREVLTNTRSIVPQASNLVDLTIYPFIIRSLLEQFGLFVFFFIGGCIVMLGKREFSSLLLYISVILAVLAFHILDSRDYVGYSRFNLFILPPILAGSIRFITWAIKQKQSVGILFVLVALGSNLLLSPVHLDGVKTAYWGNYFNDTSEHYYPYEDALIWLRDNYAKKRMLFTGLDFHYPFEFYWNKLDWRPKRDVIPSENINDEQLAISNILKDAEVKSYDIIVYRVLDEDLMPPMETGGYRTQVIRNSAHTLIIFYVP
jgi:hypothetical protein